jgi:glycosyltransferase involved in cell wall biosynthesis
MKARTAGKHVLMVTDEYPPDTGGVGRSVRRLAQSLSGDEFTVKVAVLEQNAFSSRIAQTTDGPIRVTRFGLADTREDRLRAEQAERMMRFLRAMGHTPVDLVHTFFPTSTGILAGLLARTLHKPLLASFRGNDIYHGLIGSRFPAVRWVLEHADYATFVNDESAALANAIQPRHEAWEVIRNGVGPIARDRDNGRSLNSGDAVIGMTGVFRSKKGMDCLLRACSRLRAVPAAFRLLLVGDFAPSEKTQWQGRLRELKLGAITSVTGFVRPDDVPRYLNQMDIFVYPTLYDGCPNSLLEAASAGMPIVASRTGAVAEILSEDAECLMHAPEDPEELAACLRRLLADAPLRVALARRARRRIRRSFTIEREAKQWKALYRRLTR